MPGAWQIGASEPVGNANMPVTANASSRTSVYQATPGICWTTSTRPCPACTRLAASMPPVSEATNCSPNSANGHGWRRADQAWPGMLAGRVDTRRSRCGISPRRGRTARALRRVRHEERRPRPFHRIRAVPPSGSRTRWVNRGSPERSTTSRGMGLRRPAVHPGQCATAKTCHVPPVHLIRVATAIERHGASLA